MKIVEKYLLSPQKKLIPSNINKLIINFFIVCFNELQTKRNNFQSKNKSFTYINIDDISLNFSFLAGNYFLLFEIHCIYHFIFYLVNLF